MSKRVTISGKNLDAFIDLINIYMDVAYEEDEEEHVDTFARKMQEKLDSRGAHNE